jgi:hypothetical protein
LGWVNLVEVQIDLDQNPLVIGIVLGLDDLMVYLVEVNVVGTDSAHIVRVLGPALADVMHRSVVYQCQNDSSLALR